MARADKNKALLADTMPPAAEPPDRRDEGDRLAALYGLTPKVESAVIAAIESDAVDRARSLVGPLHPADQADLIERLSKSHAARLILILGDGLEAEMLAYLTEGTRD